MLLCCNSRQDYDSGVGLDVAKDERFPLLEGALITRSKEFGIDRRDLKNSNAPAVELYSHMHWRREGARVFLESSMYFSF